MQVRTNLLTAAALSSAQEIPEIFLEPLPTYDAQKCKGAWFYKGTNPFISSVRALNAAPLLPVVIEKNQEIVIRDKGTGKVVLAVYHDRIGPEALEIMHDTIAKMMNI